MTRKDYRALADALSTARRISEAEIDGRALTASEALQLVAGEIMLVLSADNTRFNPQRFVDASGISALGYAPERA